MMVSIVDAENFEQAGELAAKKRADQKDMDEYLSIAWHVQQVHGVI